MQPPVREGFTDRRMPRHPARCGTASFAPAPIADQQTHAPTCRDRVVAVPPEGGRLVPGISPA